MQQAASWEAGDYLAIQEIAHPLWTAKVHYDVLKIRPLALPRARRIQSTPPILFL